MNIDRKQCLQNCCTFIFRLMIWATRSQHQPFSIYANERYVYLLPYEFHNFHSHHKVNYHLKIKRNFSIKIYLNLKKDDFLFVCLFFLFCCSFCFHM